MAAQPILPAFGTKSADEMSTIYQKLASITTLEAEKIKIDEEIVNVFNELSELGVTFVEPKANKKRQRETAGATPNPTTHPENPELWDARTAEFKSFFVELRKTNKKLYTDYKNKLISLNKAPQWLIEDADPPKQGRPRAVK